MGQTWVMQLPPGVPDPIFLHELAEALGKTVQEMCTGEPGMSAHELTVGWPLYHAYKARTRERAEEEAKQRSRRIG
jgi:hypothetical protein